MKLRYFLPLILALPLYAQTTNSDILPASTGLNLGRTTQRWNGYFQNVNISGTCTINGVACGSGGGGGGGSTVNGTAFQINASVSNPQILSFPTTVVFPGSVSIVSSAFTLSGSTQGQGFTATSSGQVVQTSATYIVTPFTTGVDPCAKIATGFANLASPGNGIVDARGLGTGNLTPCSASNAHAMFNSATSGYVLLPNATFWVPLSTSAAATSLLPPAGVIPLPNKFIGLVGAGRGDASTSLGTTFGVCKGTNNPVSGCIAPVTREWAISTTTITRAGGRTYLGLNVSGADLVAGEPVRIRASNTTDNNGPFRVCNVNVANSTRTDASCPANPTSSLIYVPTNSGLTGVTVSGSGTGYTTACTVSGGGGTGATCLAAVTTGNVTGITIIDPGTGYTSVPTIAVAAGSGQTFTGKIATACASNCGTLSGEIPVFDLTPLTGNQFAQRLINIAVDGEGVNDVACFRSLSGNEQSGLDHFKCAGAPERGIDVHTFSAQNMDTLRSLELYAGSSCGASCTVGTVGAFFGDIGPHGMSDWTVNFGNSPHTLMAGVIVDTNTDPFLISTGHCENIQKCVLIGWGSPGQAIKVDSVAGGPTSQCADTGCVPLDGPFQNGQSSVVTVVANYVTGSPFSRDWIFENLFRVNATDILEDWVNTTAGTNDHISNQNSMELYVSDTTNGGATQTITTDATIVSTFDALTVTNGVTATSFSGIGVNGGLGSAEGTGANVSPALGAGVDILWPDSTLHRWSMNNNNGGTRAVVGIAAAATAAHIAVFAANGLDITDGGAPSGSGTVTNIATTSPITGGAITTTGTIACATCVTSAVSLTNNQLVFGAGSQATAIGDLTGAITTAGAKATSPGKVDVGTSNEFCTAAGANTTTYTCSLSPAITAYVTGTHYRFKVDVANTAASTINFNAQGAKTIKKAAGGITTDLAANDMQAGQWVDLVYDGTNMQMQSLLGNAPGGGTNSYPYYDTKTYGGSGVPFTSGGNAILLWAVEIDHTVTVNNIAFNISTLDATNHYDIGIYGPNCSASGSCSLVTHVGAASYASTGTKNPAATSAPVSITPGLYYIATTGDATTSQIGTSNSNAFVLNPLSTTTGTATTSTAGALPSTVTLSSAGATISVDPLPQIMFH